MIEFRQVDLLASATAELMSTDALTGFSSKLRTLMQDSVVQLQIVATTVAVQFRVQVGPEIIIPTSPISGGGTIGVFPRPDEAPPLQFEGLAGDEISIELRETAAAIASVMAIIEVVPA